jgi:CubicO group peptidase (beta-lactamase class C family)
MRHLPLKNRFRAEYGYSNLMFLAAGEVIRSVSGQSWSDFIRGRILQPLGMQRTALSITELAQLGNAATPHKTSVTGDSPIPWVNWDTMAAAGGVISCADDMSKWLLLQLRRGELESGGRLFSRSTSHRMWSPHTVLPVSEAARERIPSTHFRSCGLGWMLADYRGRQTVGHGGGYDGMYSQVLLVPEEQFGVVVLTNSMTGLPQALCMTLADEFLGGPTQDWLTDGLKRDQDGRQEFASRIAEAVRPKALDTRPSHPLAACTGRWRCPLYGDASVVEENGRLVLRLLPNPDLVADLEHLHYDTFVIRWRKTFAWFAEGTIQFVPDADGVFQDLRLNVPNDDLWFDELQFRRIPDGRK